ncbi:presqualene diphosphate synthase HpnD [Oceanibaculum pacificum]|uniref:Squalene synthase HpnD n=1 Tax=Oceanibaculum pacificum TaxID=580166 RepID=A0A154VRG4_9PROT|nr:presqualene diphosphate synthase HpnD [Oceanibaculum pacificum]KZD03903.1 hypothetical protein AUP43_12435 [Oceanibaculum pacificum]
MSALAEQAHVQAIVERSKSSFYWSMRLLPPAKRQAMFAIYAFCRELDDIADGPLPLAEKRALLEDWRREIAALYAGHPAHPIARALVEPVERYGLDRRWFEEIAAGMAMDAAGDIRAPSMPELQLYCRRVAGAVGMLSIAVYGAKGRDAADFALALGDAVQLTNILRDLKEDAAMGRLYLPAEMLEAVGIRETEPSAVLAHPGMARIAVAMVDWADQRYDDAEAALAKCDRAALRPAIVILATYRRLLDRLVETGLPADHRVRLRLGEKIWIALRSAVTLKP